MKVNWITLFCGVLACLTYPIAVAQVSNEEVVPEETSPEEREQGSKEDAGNETEEIDGFQYAKIYSCAIDFPLDSVQFNEKRIEDCFLNIKRERVSYIHVIATATLTGSYDHNLYLSNRRAGAIEGYLKNRFPEVTIHAFGGGRNPKFGKSARIFIVESPENPDQETPEQKVVVEQYPIVKVETKTEIKYLPAKKTGLSVQGLGGLSSFNKNSTQYQYLGVASSYETVLPYVEGLGPISFGLRYSMNRSNSVLDIHEGALLLEKTMKLPRWLAHGEFSAGMQGLLGASYQNTVDPSFGGVGLLRYKVEDYSSAFNAGYSKHFKWVGLEVGVVL